MTTSITVQTGSTAGRSRRSQQSAPDGSPSGWLRFFVALLIVVALFTWQGIERRPTGSAGGIALNPPPAVEFQKTASTSGDRSLKATSPTAIADRAAIRIGTYNIHSGLGTDRQFDLSRIAALLQTEDFVGLNEVRWPHNCQCHGCLLPPRTNGGADILETVLCVAGRSVSGNEFLCRGLGRPDTGMPWSSLCRIRRSR